MNALTIYSSDGFFVTRLTMMTNAKEIGIPIKSGSSKPSGDATLIPVIFGAVFWYTKTYQSRVDVTPPTMLAITPGAVARFQSASRQREQGMSHPKHRKKT